MNELRPTKGERQIRLLEIDSGAVERRVEGHTKWAHYEVYGDVTFGVTNGRRFVLVDEEVFLEMCKQIGFSKLEAEGHE